MCRNRGHLAYVIHKDGVREAFKVEVDTAESLNDRLATLVRFHIKALNKLSVILEENVGVLEDNEEIILETASKKVYEWLVRSNYSKEDEPLYDELVVAFNKLVLPLRIVYVGYTEVRAARYITSKHLKESQELEKEQAHKKFSRAVDIF